MRRTICALATSMLLILAAPATSIPAHGAATQGLFAQGLSAQALSGQGLSAQGLAGQRSAVENLSVRLAKQRSVRVDQRYPVPARGSLTIRGRGYGHGHGMSQYGAEGAARQGLTWKQITNFYYPGTRLGASPDRVKVLISADTSPDVVVAARSGLRVRSHSRRRGWDLPANGSGRWRIVADSPGRSRVEYHDRTWHRWRAFAGTVSFYAGGRSIRLHHATTSRVYRGRLIAAPRRDGSTHLDTVNRVSMNNYVRGVVPAEMPPSWSPAAVQSQAVAARTYAAHQMQYPRAGHYQLCDTSACQVYNGYSGEHPRSNAAVKATKSMILTSGGRPAFTQFSSSSGGWTSANQFSYLPANKDPYDGWAGNPNHDWRLDVAVSRIESVWPAVGKLREIRVTGREGNGRWRGRITTMILIGAKGRVTVSGIDFRTRLGLKSTWVSFGTGSSD